MATAFQSVGQTLGLYRVLDGIALGSLVERYLARISAGKDAGQYVILQQLQSSLAADKAFAKLFLDEARRSASLSHGNIERIRDFGQQGDAYYLAADYLHGHSLSALTAKVRTHAEVDRRRLPIEHALTLVASVAAGLQYAHERRVAQSSAPHLIHSAVAPSRIVITYDGEVRLVDFALARVAGSEQAQRRQLNKGQIAYFSPEQCNGASLEQIDRRSDIFSLGVVLYELTTGKRLFRTTDSDSDYAVMNRIMKGEVTPPRSFMNDYPTSLEDVVLQALSSAPAARHPTAKALMLDVQAVARTQNIQLSQTALADYLSTTLGPKLEPWKELDDDEDPAEGIADSGAGDFDDDIDPDEFGEEVATTLYTGNVEDIKDAWAAEALAPGVRASSHAGLGRPTEGRIALPLQAGDSGAFLNPTARRDAKDSLLSRDAPSGNHIRTADVAHSSTEPTALDGLPIASGPEPIQEPTEDPVSVNQQRSLSRPGTFDGTGSLPNINSTASQGARRYPTGRYVDIQPRSPTGPSMPTGIARWQVISIVALGVVLVVLLTVWLAT